MTYNLRWRKAVMVSVICHIFLGISAGYLSAHMLAMPVLEEKYVELELMNQLQPENASDSIPSAIPTSSAHLSDSSSLLTSAPSTSASPIASQSVVTPESLTATNTSDNGASRASVEPSGTAISSTTNNANTSHTSSTGTKSQGGGIIQPSILNKVDTTYPQAARQAGIEGTVLLKIQISANGHAGSISISRSSGNEQLDNAAIASVMQWNFVPARDRDSGQPVTCYTTIPISFRLN